MSLFGRWFAAGYDWFAQRTDDQGAREHRRALVAQAEGEVLEVGTGTGRNLPFYERAARVVALEPASDMRARAVQRAQGARVPVEVIDGDGMDLPFPDAAFDTVVFGLVLCTIPDPERALTEARRVLRPTGTVRFYEHVRSSDPEVARRQDRWERPWRWFGQGCHCNRETIRTIEAAGFRVESTTAVDLTGVPAIVRPHVLGIATLTA